MDTGDGVHIPAGSGVLVDGGGPDVFECPFMVAQGLGVETEVEMSVELGLRLAICRRHHVLWGERAGIQAIDLLHRDPRIGTDREQLACPFMVAQGLASSTAQRTGNAMWRSRRRQG